jgi:hypothetical protein
VLAILSIIASLILLTSITSWRLQSLSLFAFLVFDVREIDISASAEYSLAATEAHVCVDGGSDETVLSCIWRERTFS